MTVNLSFPGHGSAFVWLVEEGSPQDLTSTWTDMGDQQFVQGAEIISLWVDVDVNSSKDLEVRFQMSYAEGGDEYYHLIGPDVENITSPPTIDATIDDEEDYKAIVGWRLFGMVPWIQFQVRVFQPGDTTQGRLLSAAITTHR